MSVEKVGEVVVGVSDVLRVDRQRVMHRGGGKVVVVAVTRMHWRWCAFLGGGRLVVVGLVGG